MEHVIGYGSPDTELIDLALANFDGASFAPLSFCTTPVELLSLDGKETRISHATGFYWRQAGLDFVVTNWHVLAGRSPFTGELLDRVNAFIPRRIRVHGWRIVAHVPPRIEVQRTAWVVDLQDHGMELFADPPRIDGRVVDVAAVPIPPGFALERAGELGGAYGTLKVHVNLVDQDRIASLAGDECVLLGYPLGQYSGLMFPIWKRGSLATETNLGVDGSPAFLIDAATSPAMSGSPIFRRVFGPVQLDPETKTVSQMRGFQFSGVYGGRLLSSDLASTNLGYGWFGNQVDGAVANSWERWRTIMKTVAAERESESP